jgi:predicted AAA+ superfamily ATPase
MFSTHPKIGASWEGYANKELLKVVAPDEVYYWMAHNGAELDLLLLKDGRRISMDCKRVDSPCLTSSMRTALEALELGRIFVIYHGNLSFPITDQVTGLPISELGKTEPGNLFVFYYVKPEDSQWVVQKSGGPIFIT